MKWWSTKGVLQKQGWQEPTFIQTDDKGIITTITKEQPKGVQDHLDGWLIPGFQNAHSHAFQYAMSGVAEHRPATTTTDDFWAWRESMYRLALSISPEQMEAVAAQLYSEMLRNGYTSVVEFHYLHNDVNGDPFENSVEMCEKLIAAALRTGIRLTLVPILYQMGDFDKQATPEQRRFLCKSTDEYLKLIDSCRHSMRLAQVDVTEQIHLGAGVHSLRAVSGKAILEVYNSLEKDCPFHIHVAEQVKEVESSKASLGKRPVEYLLDLLPNMDKVNVVHATHMSLEECKRLANSEANVVLCPSTEANLGDGVFPFQAYAKEGGSWSIGSDSNIGLSPFEELRWLDYVQRLQSSKRGILCPTRDSDSGTRLIEFSFDGGRRAQGFSKQNYFEVGSSLDGIIVNSPLLNELPESHRLSSLVFGHDSTAITHVIVNGRILVQQGVHLQTESIQNDFSRAMQQLYR